MARSAAGIARTAVVEAVSVIAGAIIGTLVAAVFGWLFLSVSFGALAGSASVYVLALVTVAIFAVLYANLPATPAVLGSLGVGILLPTVIARFAFDAAEPLGTLLILNLVFALVALSVYRFVHASGLVRRAADDVADRA
ncbi:hypothetical protein D3218_15495 [Aureimonas flava]|uniref:Uncharacterized protein n=1 Tax=Aureimonas flava TaxID=2320271 RepID=A0A3A1WIC0_9HYPH|nr:hypothetical protein [Aureimonas flava]RIX99173.1 hypothetical protein D3218_15495 [Aureimonas flava]